MMRFLRLFCAITLLFVVSAQAQTALPVTIGAGERGGNYYSVGGAICRIVNQNSPYGCAVRPTGGSIDNLYALSLGDVNFAIIQADVQRAARRGIAGIPGNYSALRSVASVYPQTLTVVVRADSDIGRFVDLRGRRIAAGTIVSGAHWTFMSLWNALGLSIDDLSSLVVQRDGTSADALCSGRLDAVVMMTGHPSISLSRMGRTCPIKIVALSVTEVAAITRNNPDYRPIAVPPGLYPFVRAPVPTVATDATLVTISSVPDQYVEAVLTAILSDRRSFRQQQKVLGPVPSSHIEGALQYHRAAARFYRAYGLIR